MDFANVSRQAQLVGMVGAHKQGKKKSESFLATLRNSGAVNLSRRRHGVDGEMATTREKEDTTTKRTTSLALGWCRISPEMHGCGGW